MLAEGSKLFSRAWHKVQTGTRELITRSKGFYQLQTGLFTLRFHNILNRLTSLNKMFSTIFIILKR